MLTMKLVIFLIILTSIKALKNPCKHYKHGNFKFKIPDPYNCTKFWMCSEDRGRKMSCPIGTSFEPDLLFGSCIGPHPKRVKNCHKYTNKYEALEKRLQVLIRNVDRLLTKLEDYVDYQN